MITGKNKFRVWNDSQLIYSDEYVNLYEFFKQCCFDDEKAQQFTGLLDNNGKEIFEGDVISVRHFEGWFDEESFLVNEIVFFNENEAAFKLGTQSTIDRGYSGGELTKRRIEKDNLIIIGNIYENPELL